MSHSERRRADARARLDTARYVLYITCRDRWLCGRCDRTIFARRRLPDTLAFRSERHRAKARHAGCCALAGPLRSPPGNRLEALKADRKGQFSIRVNDRWRVCFVWTEGGPDRVEVVDYH